ncbi:MAG: hypothetical protein AMJ54_14075 [Deltaproteobacteria bacterium SG8_13]|nr:MAG: hypothetical protein AMJ54_14075 [Deltaproteobacteria bacterium SG8_13]
MTRRETLHTLLKLTGTATLAGAGFWPTAARSAAQRRRFYIEVAARFEGTDVKTLTRKTFEAAGGMQRFVSRGDVVVIKPNLSWARRPELAATTHPEVLQSVIELCQEAGAKKVRIADNTIHDARRCFAITGAGQVAKQTGADLIYPRSSLMRDMNLRGSRLEVWPVFTPLVEADKLINLPVAKHHSLSRLTLGMKNWIGGVDGSRWSLHQDINQTIVDLAHFFEPTVTLIDAVRIMTRNGPSGGSTADVAVKNTLILSDDPVAADAGAAMLFGSRPEEIGFIRLGQKQGLGTADFQQLDYRKVAV